MFTSAFGIRLTSAVYTNDRLSPPFAVYAAWTLSTPLFMLEVDCELSSFIGGFGRVVLSRFLLLSAQK